MYKLLDNDFFVRNANLDLTTDVLNILHELTTWTSELDDSWHDGMIYDVLETVLDIILDNVDGVE